jgi:hypothetical protein
VQIPKHLLIHSVTHQYGPPVNDDWGNPTWPNTRTLTRVRVEPSGKIVLDRSTDANTEIRLSALMFYDAVNSSPQGVAFAYGDKVTFDGQQYRVASIDRLYDGMAFHHLEIGLR